MKTLIAYFSASGQTAKLAKTIADVTGGDLFEIAPETAYTAADLDWMDKKSRSTIEMKDPKSRPAIAGKVADMGQYDTVFVGFPIWWYQAPRIIETFLWRATIFPVRPSSPLPPPAAAAWAARMSCRPPAPRRPSGCPASA